MNVERVEHITVKVNIEANYRGRVGMRIISPTGVISDLAAFRRSDASGKGFRIGHLCLLPIGVNLD